VLNNPLTTFQFNPTPPLVNRQNDVFVLDINAASVVSYSFALSKMAGGLAPGSTNMWTGTSSTIASNVAVTTADNAGIYLTAEDWTYKNAFLGLANGRIYMLSLQ
jgi:hypothetical protein